MLYFNNGVVLDKYIGKREPIYMYKWLMKKLE